MTNKTIIGLEVSLSIPERGCPNACWHCPQQHLLAVYPKGAPRHFTLEAFQRCMKTVPAWRHLAWTGFSEPMICPDFVPIIQWAHNRGHVMAISTTLRGSTRESIDAMASLPWKWLVLHVPDAHGWMKLPVTDEYLSLFEYATNKLPATTPDFIWSTYTDPHPKILPIMEASGYPIPRFGLHDRCGMIENLPHQTNFGRIPLCHKMFCGNLLPNGWLCLCCDDYQLQHVLGDLNDDDYMGIYRGPKFRKFLEDLKDPESKVLCRHCSDNCREGFDPEHPVLGEFVLEQP